MTSEPLELARVSDQSISSLPGPASPGRGKELLECHQGHNSTELVISPHDDAVDDVGPVGGPDDEDVLLGAHAVHLGEDLVDHPVAGAAAVLATAAAKLYKLY